MEELKILLVEDEPLDAELVEHALKSGGIVFRSERVDTPEAFQCALEIFQPDVILSDYRMPHFSGVDALRLAKAHAPEVPFLLVTGSLNEEIAVECMKAGASDYVLKERLARLPLAVHGAREAQRQRLARERAEEQTQIQAAALAAAANGIVITDRAGNVEWVNPAYTDITGFTLAEARGIPPPFMRSSFHPPLIYQQIRDTVNAGKVWQGELYSRRKDDSVLLEDITITPVRNREDRVTRFVAVIQDLSARKRQEEEIRQLASQDPLTHLPNRASFQAELAQAIEMARHGGPAALLLLDIDHFKVLNDSMGTAVGDRVLAWIGDRLAADMDEGAVVSRLGNDEFAVLMTSESLEAAVPRAEELRQRACAVNIEEVGASDFALTMSGGLAPIDGSLDVNALWALTETALKSARDLGGDRIVIPSDEAEAVRKRSADVAHWGATVRECLRNNRFQLHAQPVVRLSTGETVHREVLVRMRDSAGGLVMPGKFLPAAEHHGLLPQLDRWIVERSLLALARNPELSLFVNLSGTTLADSQFLASIEQSIARVGGASGRLAFEITETEAVADLERVRRWIFRLKDLGVAFALDDFGTGFSSFAYLRVLPVDYVKIDGSFIRDLDTNPSNRALVQAMTAVAHTLGQQVIAEWVERAEIVAVLEELGVEWGQGYHFGRPEPLEEATETVSTAP